MKNPASGMTLIEVMIALVVLVIGLSAAMATVVYSSRSVSTGLHVQQATTMAQSLLTVLTAVPFASSGSGNSAAPNSLFSNFTTANDGDVADQGQNFMKPTLPANSYDHVDSELPASIQAMVAPATAINGITFERYWNIAPMAATTGVVIAVIVRWHENAAWQRTVVVGTRYAP